MPKKDFSSFEIAVIIQELQNKITKSRINKIYQYDKKTVVLKLHKKDNPQIRLVMEAGKRIHLTSYLLNPPKIPPNFCMILRKYLNGAWIEKIEQFEFERIVLLYLRKKNENWKIILELFGEGNIILLDEANKILQALIFKKMRDRNIIRNEIYQFPPTNSKNPYRISQDELIQGLTQTSNIEIVRSIARLLGIGGLYSEEILYRANIKKNILYKDLKYSDFEAIFLSIQDLLSTIKDSKINPRLILDKKNQLIDVIPIELYRYKTSKFKTEKTFNEAIDAFFIKDTIKEKTSSVEKRNKLQKNLEQIDRIIDEQKNYLESQKKAINLNKNIGDIIYSQSNILQLLLDLFSPHKRSGKNWATLFKEVFNAKKKGKMPEKLVESFDSEHLSANIKINNLKFSLNLRKNIFENAAEYYDISKKARQKSEGAFSALQLSLKKREDLRKKLQKNMDSFKTEPEQILVELEKRKIKTKRWYEKFRWFKTSDGFLVVAGKDSISNEVLIKKHTDGKDLVFHADIIGAPFVVLKLEEKVVSERSLLEASEFAAALSRSWREGAASSDVYWVAPNQLSKSGPSGEYVPKGGFMVYGKRNWMRNVPLKLAIGVIHEDSNLTFIGGPISAIKALTKYYVIFIPGEMKGKELIKMVILSLVEKLPKEMRRKALKTSPEQVREFIPYTKARILKD